MNAYQERLWARCHADGMQRHREGNDRGAEAQFRAALGHAERGKLADARRAATLYQLATICRLSHRDAEAEKLFKEAIAIDERDLGPDHPLVAITLRGYARLLRQMRRGTEAARVEQRADAIWRGAAGRESRFLEFAS